MEEIIKDGVRYTKKIKDRQVCLERVSVNWSRPIFEGSKKGKTIYYYPADEILSPPKKGRASYKTLNNGIKEHLDLIPSFHILCHLYVESVCPRQRPRDRPRL